MYIITKHSGILVKNSNLTQNIGVAFGYLFVGIVFAYALVG
jgi:hypothetical protein